MKARMITPPTMEPLTLTEAKTHLRVDLSDEDALITSLITVSRQFVEDDIRRALLTQSWRITLDAWPDVIELPRPPLASVESVKYKDKDGVESTLAETEYIVGSTDDPGRIVPAYGKAWPTAILAPIDGVTVDFTAGWETADDVPAPIKHAMLLLIGHWYANREATGKDAGPMAFAVDALLEPYRAVRL